MAGLRIHLFGKLCIRQTGQVLTGLEARKAQELFAYLLLHRGRSHAREALATVLWNEAGKSQAQKSLRQALWQLQTVLDNAPCGLDGMVLQVDSNWVQINPNIDLWLDVAVLEQRFAETRGAPGQALDAQRAASLQEAVQLYQGDLLEDCYQDWCLYERERLQRIYLALLDKLMAYCEAQGEYEAGLVYGTQILRHDCAREQTYQQLMRLHYLAGDRTAALRQYERCVAMLAEELGVQPSHRTLSLYEAIKSERLPDDSTGSGEEHRGGRGLRSLLPGLLGRLRHYHTVLAEVQQQVERDISTVETMLNAPALDAPGRDHPGGAVNLPETDPDR